MESTEETYYYPVQPQHYGIHPIDTTGTSFVLYHRDIKDSPYPFLRPLTLIYNLNDPMSVGNLETKPSSIIHTCGAILKVEFHEPHYLTVKIDSASVYFLASEPLRLEYIPPIHAFSCPVCRRTSGPGTCPDIEARKLFGLSMPSWPEDSIFRSLPESKWRRGDRNQQ